MTTNKNKPTNGLDYEESSSWRRPRTKQSSVIERQLSGIKPTNGLNYEESSSWRRPRTPWNTEERFKTNTHNTTLYIGVTSNLIQRIYQHKNKLVDGFSKTYNLQKLVYFEPFPLLEDAILREKRLFANNI